MRDRLNDQLLLRLGPVIFVVLWSGGFTAVRLGLLDSGPLTFLVARYLLVLAVLAPLVLALRPPFPERRAVWGHLVAVALLMQVLYFALINISLELGTSATGVALIASLQPILVALAVPRLTGEHVGTARWAGLALGLGGAALVIVTRGDIRASPLGVMGAAGALLAITTGTLYERRFGVDAHPVSANLVQFAIAFLVLLPVAYAVERLRLHPTLRFGAALAYLALANSLISISLLLAMIRRGDAARVSALFFLVPPVAGLIALLVLGEQMPPLGWVGMAIAASGVALATRKNPAQAVAAKQ